jgi:hypothetical protein
LNLIHKKEDKIKRHVLIGKAWSWTIVGSMFGKCHASCMSKTFPEDFENEEAYCFRYKRQKFSSILNSPCLFSGSQKLLTYPNFYIAFIYYWTCYRPENMWNTACNNHSISKHPVDCLQLNLIKLRAKICAIKSIDKNCHNSFQQAQCYC